MKEKILRLNQIANQSYNKGATYEINYNYIRKNYEIIKYGKYSLIKLRENLTAKEAIYLMELILDILEVER